MHRRHQRKDGKHTRSSITANTCKYSRATIWNIHIDTECRERCVQVSDPHTRCINDLRPWGNNTYGQWMWWDHTDSQWDWNAHVIQRSQNSMPLKFVVLPPIIKFEYWNSDMKPNLNKILIWKMLYISIIWDSNPRVLQHLKKHVDICAVSLIATGNKVDKMAMIRNRYNRIQHPALNKKTGMRHQQLRRH